MTRLTYNADLRLETDDDTIATLMRKGWLETAPPPHDPATQHAPEWVGGDWLVRQLTAEDIYNTARSNLAAYWASQPAWIRGPFDASYQSAVSLLDRHDIDAAIAIITYAPIPSAYDADQVSTFETVRAALLVGLESLPAIAQE